MKLYNKIKVFSICLVGVAGLYSCNFLDRKPLDNVDPEKFYTNAEQLGSFSINYYSIFPQHSGFGIGVAAYDNGTDNQISADPNRNMFSHEHWKVPASGGIGINNIRNVNWFIETVNERIKNGLVSGNSDDINHYMGEAYFIRAYLYFNKLVDYGDYPIVTSPLKEDEQSLVENSKRQPRNEVARFILSDLDKAISLLKNETPMNQRISKKVALLFKSRVALFEATFEKYHRGSGRVPGDDKWPGKNKEWNKGKSFNMDQEIDFFLTQAMESAKQCADMVPFSTQNTHVIDPDINQGKNAEAGWNPYFEMFSDRDLSKYPEVLLWAQYSKSKNKTHGLSNYLRKGTGSGWTRSLVNSFLTKNGLPIYADNSYAGDETLDKVKQNRDERLQLFMFSESTKLPVTPNNPKFETYKCPHFFNVKEIKDVTGFVQRKYYSYDPNEDISAELNSQGGCPVFRVAEAYLNYIEACYEKTGSIDATASGYWKALRRRAGVDEDFNKTIAATNMSKEANVNEPSYDWGAFSAGKPVDATLYNIRREKRCEFAGEGYRMIDLLRWRAMDQVKNYQIEGVNIWDKIYDYDYFKKDGKSIIISDGSEKANISNKSLSKYLRPLQVIKVNNDMYGGYTFYQAHYLAPFSRDELVRCSPNASAENSNLYQNPGWPLEAEGKAME